MRNKQYKESKRYINFNKIINKSNNKKYDNYKNISKKIF